MIKRIKLRTSQSERERIRELLDLVNPFILNNTVLFEYNSSDEKEIIDTIKEENITYQILGIKEPKHLVRKVNILEGLDNMENRHPIEDIDEGEEEEVGELISRSSLNIEKELEEMFMSDRIGKLQPTAGNPIMKNNIMQVSEILGKFFRDGGNNVKLD